MNLLGFDTATAVTSVCVLREDGETFGSAPPPPGWMDRPAMHASELMPSVRDLLARAGISYADLDAIAIGVGPGTFTGLRIGVATARALAQALGIGARPVSTLATLALGMASEAGDHRSLLPAIDAKRGEVFHSLWEYCDGAPRTGSRNPIRLDRGWLCQIRPEAVDAPGKLAERIGGEGIAGIVAAGDGAVRHASVLRAAGVEIPDAGQATHVVRADNLCAIAAGLESIDAREVEPTYIRLPDAEERIRKIASANHGLTSSRLRRVSK